MQSPSFFYGVVSHVYYKTVAVRPFRALGYALDHNLQAIMDADYTSQDGDHGVPYLKKPLESWWPSRYYRPLLVPYPYQVDKDAVRAGDFGVWRVRPGLPPLFITLGNVRHDFPGPLTLFPALGNEEYSQNIFR